MQFTKQDAITFAIGAGVAVAFELGLSLIRLQGDIEAPDFSLEDFGIKLGVGLGAALGRYLTTRLADHVLGR
jgi:hypothetical protein